MRVTHRWRKEAGPRLQGSRDLDSGKLQGPCIVRNPVGGYRLFYTAVGPGKPYPACQGYILSAISDDGLTFSAEPGIRLAPRPQLEHISLRVLVPTITPIGDGWRMYFESRGRADQPTVICSAVSADMLHWEHEDGVRLQSSSSLRGPRYRVLPDRRGRLYCCGSTADERYDSGVVSAVTSDGVAFEFERGYRLGAGQRDYDTGGVTAAEVIALPPGTDTWSMVFSAWQDVPPGTEVPLHPSADLDAVENGRSADFAAASIATDMAGYRSRIYMAYSNDGLDWKHGECAIDSTGYGGKGLDAVHAEDMSVIGTDDGRCRMYYAACDRDGVWRIASAVGTVTNDEECRYE